MTTRRPEQALQEYIDRLGEDRGRYIKAVQDDVSHLWMHAGVYWALFGTNKERIDLFNSISGDCAYWIERSMFESLILHVCRLTDPVKTNGKKKNVTVKALSALLACAPDLELETRIEQAEIATRFARDWRNRRIAHSDANVMVGSATLDSASRYRLKQAIQAIAACVRRYAVVELGFTLGTQPTQQYEKDEVAFLTALYYGKTHSEGLKSRRDELIQRRELSKIEELENLPEWLTEGFDLDEGYD